MQNPPLPVFSYEPDRIEFSQGQRYKTSIIDFHTGVEQRSSFWSKPRHGLQFTYNYITPDDRVHGLAAFHAARKGSFEPFFIPTWGRNTWLTSAIAIGGLTFNVGTSAGFTNATKAYGKWLYIWDEVQDRGEVAEIYSFSPTTIVALTGTQFAYPNGSPICVAMVGRFASDELRLKFSTTEVSQTRVDFYELPEETP